MADAAPAETPALLLVVTGIPGAGKTTLGSALADALGVPFLSLDAIKERLYADGNSRADRYALRLAAEGELAVRLAATPGTVVVDVWIAPGRDTERITELLQQAGKRVVELLCRVPTETAVARYVRRRRGGPHLPPDEATVTRIREASAAFKPLGIGTCIEVDTSGQLDLQPTLACLRAAGAEVSTDETSPRSTDKG